MRANRDDFLDLLTDDRLSGSVITSFRDPDGRMIITKDRALRVVNREYEEELNEILNSPVCLKLVDEGMLINTRLVTESDLKEQLSRFAPSQVAPPIVLEHDHISFPSYPYEWPAEMLFAAGTLTLDLMERLIPEGFGLKDASPYNILFRGSKPLFVDLLSIEKRDLYDPTWLAYGQFVRTFIRPLLANKYFGLGLDQIFRVYRDGLQPEHVYRMSSTWRKIHPLFLTSVSLPALLSRLNPKRYQSIYQPKRAASAEQASFILKRQLRGLRRKLEGAKPAANRKSAWTDYEKCEHHDQHLETKDKFVASAIEERKPANVLDAGCNMGHFSLLAAQAGSSVVAIDRDPVVVGQVWSRAHSKRLDVLPLVVDLARPPAGLGWRNRETRGFLDRALGSFDCVLMLALIHHLLVTERIPLAEILELASELTTDLLLIEFVGPDDPMFQLITRGNDRLYRHLTRELFETVSEKYFVIERVEQLSNSQRWLYQMRRRPRLA